MLRFGSMGVESGREKKCDMSHQVRYFALSIKAQTNLAGGLATARDAKLFHAAIERGGVHSEGSGSTIGPLNSPTGSPKSFLN